MTGRHLGSAIILLVHLGCADAGRPMLQVGDPVASGAVGLPHSGAGLLWVLQPDDYVRCESYAREIRRLQRQSSTPVELTVVAVGGHDDWARAFVSRERVAARVVAMARRTYQREFGRAPRSALYIVEAGVVRAAYPIDGAAELAEGELSTALAGI